MIAIAKQNRVRISPQKAKLICDLIRNHPVDKAIMILNNLAQKGAAILHKLLKSAISNAINNHAMNADKLYIYQIAANQGTTIKRTLPRAKGSADLIRKRSTNFIIVLSDDPTEKQKALQQIKERMKKRTINQKQAKAKLVKQQSLPTKVSEANVKVNQTSK